MRLAETRTIYADKVRALCIKQNYYTCGTVREYGDMLDFVDNEKADEFIILTAARDILKHSDTKALMSMYGIDDEKELLAVAKQVMEREDLKYCPHGRPICVSLSKKQLEKQFRRT